MIHTFPHELNPHRADRPVGRRRASVLEGGHAEGSLQAVVAQLRAEGVEVDFDGSAFETRGGELGLGPSPGVEVDVVGVLAGDAGRDGGFPEAILDQQRGLHSCRFPFAVGGAGGDVADDGQDLVGVDQAAFDPESRTGAFGTQGDVGVVVAADVGAGGQIAAQRGAAGEKQQRQRNQDEYRRIARCPRCRHAAPFCSFLPRSRVLYN